MSFNCCEPATKSSSTPRNRLYDCHRNLGSKRISFVTRSVVRIPWTIAVTPGTALRNCFQDHRGAVRVVSEASLASALVDGGSDFLGFSNRAIGNAGIS